MAVQVKLPNDTVVHHHNDIKKPGRTTLADHIGDLGTGSLRRSFVPVTPGFAQEQAM
jgi:hypothetical protein